MGPQRSTTGWGLWMGLLSLCSLVTLPPSSRAEDQAFERLEAEAFCLAMPWRCLPGTAQTTADPLRHRHGSPLPSGPPSPREGPTPRATPQAPDPPAASALPEDPLASECRYVGFQTEWVASKRDAGLSLGAALAAARRVFARDLPGHAAIVGALGPLVYRDPQRSPAELRQTMEAACLAHPLLWADHRSDW
jgi:hypothetical protein